MRLTDNDGKLISELLVEFEPTRHPVLVNFADLMPSGDWAWVCDYTRRWVREHATQCLATRAYALFLRDNGVLDRNGVNDLFHGSLIVEAPNFGLQREGRDEFREHFPLEADGHLEHQMLAALQEIADEIKSRIIGDLDPWVARC